MILDLNSKSYIEQVHQSQGSSSSPQRNEKTSTYSVSVSVLQPRLSKGLVSQCKDYNSRNFLYTTKVGPIELWSNHIGTDLA